MKDRSLYLRDKSNQLIAQVEMATNRMFKLNLVNIKVTCLNTCVEEKYWLWHLRFGHINFGGLKEMTSKKMVHGLPLLDSPDKFCEGCVIGKHPRSSFPKVAEYRAKNLLELVHIDICGMIQPSSIGENQYFITFIDDFSCKT
jgi:GAG-pre-integrase domain